MRALHISRASSSVAPSRSRAVALQVVVVSEKFEGKALLARHRMVNSLFSEEMKGDLHGEKFGITGFSVS